MFRVSQDEHQSREEWVTNAESEMTEQKYSQSLT